MFHVKYAIPEHAERFELAKTDPFVILPYFTILHVEGCDFLPTLTAPDLADRWVYFLQPVAGGPIKIGTAQNVENRFGYIQGSHWQKLCILGRFWGNTGLEIALHRRFRARALQHEWFEDHAELQAAIRYLLANAPQPPAVTLMGRRRDDDLPGYLRRKARIDRRDQRRAARALTVPDRPAP